MDLRFQVAPWVSDAKRYRTSVHPEPTSPTPSFPEHNLNIIIQYTMKLTLAFLAISGASAFAPSSSGSVSTALRSTVASDVYTFTKSNEIFEEAKTVSSFEKWCDSIGNYVCHSCVTGLIEWRKELLVASFDRRFVDERGARRTCSFWMLSGTNRWLFIMVLGFIA